MTVSQGT